MDVRMGWRKYRNGWWTSSRCTNLLVFGLCGEWFVMRKRFESHINSTGFQRQKTWCTRSYALDEQMRSWVITMWERGVLLPDLIIQEKTQRLQRTVNATLSPSERTSCAFSNGWLYKFKKRYGFRCHKSHGEDGDADNAGAATALPHLRELASQ